MSDLTPSLCLPQAALWAVTGGASQAAGHYCGGRRWVQGALKRAGSGSKGRAPG